MSEKGKSRVRKGSLPLFVFVLHLHAVSINYSCHINTIISTSSRPKQTDTIATPPRSFVRGRGGKHPAQYEVLISFHKMMQNKPSEELLHIQITSYGHKLPPETTID